MKNIIRKLCLGLSVLFLFSCSLSNQKSTISISFPFAGNSEIRTADDSDLATNEEIIELAYTIIVQNDLTKVTATGVSGETVSIEVQPGTYSVTVNASNEDESIRYTGITENVVVIEGQDNPITVKLHLQTTDESTDDEEDSLEITFIANGGNGNQDSIIQPKDSEIILPECSYTPNGKKHFKYWATEATVGDDTRTFTPNTTITLESNITLYAIWEDNPKAEVSIVNPEIFETILTAGEGVYNVKMTATEETKIYYTTDGTEPTTASAVYAEDGEKGLEIKEPVTLKFIATNDYYNDSDAGEVQVRFRLGKVQFSAESDYVAAGDKIELTSVEGASIYYTIDGSEPLVDSVLNNALLYEAPIEITQERITIKATAIAEGYEYSETVTREFYTFKTNFNYTIVLGEEVVGGFSNEEAAKNAVINNSVPTALQNFAYPTKIWLSKSQFIMNTNLTDYYIETSYDASGNSNILVKVLNKQGEYEDISDKAYVKYYYVFKSFNTETYQSTYEVRVDIKLDVEYSYSGRLFYLAQKGVPKNGEILMNCQDFDYIEVQLIGNDA